MALDGNIRKLALGIVAAWLTLGLPWLAGVWAIDQARPVVKEAIGEHADKDQHPDVRGLEIQQARVEEKVNAIDDKIDMIQTQVEQLVNLQLSPRT